MTDGERQSMKQFDAKVRKLIADFAVLKGENEQLKATIQSNNEEIAKLSEELKTSQKNYDNLKLAKMISISDSEKNSARLRISKLVREVNKCISLLNSEMNNDSKKTETDKPITEEPVSESVVVEEEQLQTEEPVAIPVEDTIEEKIDVSAEQPTNERRVQNVATQKYEGGMADMFMNDDVFS